VLPHRSPATDSLPSSPSRPSVPLSPAP
jgi:hypothetical protein